MSPDPLVHLLDVEGTTTPVDFVYKVLFPFARLRAEKFLQKPEARPDINQLRLEQEKDARAGLEPPREILAYVLWLMDSDRKSTALKSLQGKIWEEGYRSGELRGEIYPDVRRAFERWRGQGKDLAVFSSGSVLAQKLLFAHSTAGDLASFFRAHFDTTTGPKFEAESYRGIASALDARPESILFISDAGAELDAARSAGLGTRLCCREGRRPTGHAHTVITSFDDLD